MKIQILGFFLMAFVMFCGTSLLNGQEIVYKKVVFITSVQGNDYKYNNSFVDPDVEISDKIKAESVSRNFPIEIVSLNGVNSSEVFGIFYMIRNINGEVSFKFNGKQIGYSGSLNELYRRNIDLESKLNSMKRDSEEYDNVSKESEKVKTELIKQFVEDFVSIVMSQQ